MQTQDPAAYGAVQPGWYADPWNAAPYRWWDGAAWTGYTTPATPAASRPRARDDLRGGGLAFIGFILTEVLVILVALGVHLAGASFSSIAVQAAGFVGIWTGLFGTAYFVVHRRNHARLADIGLVRPRAGEVGLGVGIAFAMVVVTFVVLFVLVLLLRFHPTTNGAPRSGVLVPHHPSWPAIAFLFAAACIGAPFFEEIFFRGLVQSIVARRAGTVAAIFIQAVLFGLVHLQIGMDAKVAVIRVCSVAAGGTLLGWLRHYTGRLPAGMVAHATYNFIIVGLSVLIVLHR